MVLGKPHLSHFEEAATKHNYLARGLNHDHEGGSSRARLLHCTKEWLTPAISPNVGNSTSSFLLVGICVRANPFKFDHFNKKHSNTLVSSCFYKLGSVAGPVIQANGRLEFEDGLRTGVLLHCVSR